MYGYIEHTHFQDIDDDERVNIINQNIISLRSIFNLFCVHLQVVNLQSGIINLPELLINCYEINWYKIPRDSCSSYYNDCYRSGGVKFYEKISFKKLGPGIDGPGLS